MKYTEEDNKYIENLLNISFKHEIDNKTYFILNKNINRLVKINRILKNGDIKINLDKINKYDIILIKNTDTRKFHIHFYYIWGYFFLKYKMDFIEYDLLISDILCKIFNCKYYQIISIKQD